MRRHCANLFPLISMLLLFSTLSNGQAWSGILTSSRAIDWSNAGLPATLPDSETTATPWTPPVRTQCVTTACQNVTTNAGSSTVAQINSAISSAPAGTYVLLPAGTYTINSTVIMYGVNNVTLRGSGPQTTILNITSGDYIAMGEYFSGGTGKFSANYAAGTTSITVTGATSTPVAGNLAQITQCDTGSGVQPCSTVPSDDGSIYVCGDYDPCQGGSDTDSAYTHQEQNVIITAVTNNGGGSYTLTISPGLYMPNWVTTQGAIISWDSSSNLASGLGLEDMTLHSPINSGNYIVQAANTYASWIKGVKILGLPASFPLKVQGSKNFLIFNNYCASAIALSGYSACYSVDTSSDVLTLNNIAAQGIGTEYDGRNVGVVTAYNFDRDAFTLYTEDQWAFDHHAFSSFDLYEGNESGTMDEDNIWGTHALNTYFRNYIVGFDAPYAGGTPNARGLNLNNYQRFENVVGNVIGSSQITAYEGTGYGTAFQIGTGDSLVASTLMRWGNVTNIKQSTDTPANSGVRFVSSEVASNLASPNAAWENPVPSNDNLPCSFFLGGYTSTTCTAHPNGGTGLSWWKVCTTWTTFPTACATTQTQPFPVTGPDVTGGPYVNGYSYDIPAAIAWQNLPIDTTYQNSYPIISSSWASGVETLTVTGLPTGSVDIIGPFQISGTGSGTCTTGANKECFMTNSSVVTNTISYALASNPGSLSGGTVKFPDIRQFDERVYQDDSGGDPPPSAPTGLAAQVSP
jgi:hypothetical protein